MRINFNAVIFTILGIFLQHFFCFSVIFSNFLVVYRRFGKILKSKMADPRWRLFEYRTVLSRDMTSSSHVTYTKRQTPQNAIYSISFIVIALIFWKLPREVGEEGRNPLPVWENPKELGLNRVKSALRNNWRFDIASDNVHIITLILLSVTSFLYCKKAVFWLCYIPAFMFCCFPWLQVRENVMIIYQALSVTGQSYLPISAERGDTEKDVARPAVPVMTHSEYQKCDVAMWPKMELKFQSCLTNNKKYAR